MAPTSLLVEQHAATLRSLVDRLPPSARPTIATITSSTKGAERTRVYEALADGTVHIVIGTTSLIQGKVKFLRLGLAVVDEEQRFGVEQRKSLLKDFPAHVLHMSATPIPRTLALMEYGEMTLSLLGELPPGRKPVTTEAIDASERNARERALEKIRAEARTTRHVACLLFVFVRFPVTAARAVLGWEPADTGHSAAVVLRRTAGAGRRARVRYLLRPRRGEHHGRGALNGGAEAFFSTKLASFPEHRPTTPA